MSKRPIPQKVRAEVLSRHGHACHYCGKSLRFTLEPCGFEPGVTRVVEGERPTFDHVLPRSRGGSNKAANLVPACRSCNSTKRAKTAEEFAAWLGARA